MMVVVVMVPMASDHDDRSATPMAVMVMVVVMMMMVLGKLDACVGGRGLAFVDDLQDSRGVRDRLQQVGVGIGLERIRRGDGGWRRLRGRHRAESRHRSQ
jgi:hypothetical protein